MQESSESEVLPQAADEGEAVADTGAEEAKDSDQSAQSKVTDDLPAYAKERLGRQEKRHRKEMQALRQQMSLMQPQQQQAMPENGNAPPTAVDDQIQRAVTYALQHKERMEHQAKDAQKHAHLQEQYQALQEQLDNGSSKYDDFDEVVRSSKAPFTEAMRDAALLLPHNNADEVLYKLGKNTAELKRISELHPLDQARELMKLSVALKEGSGKQNGKSAQPIGQIKNQPVTSSGISEKSSIREIREKMKSNWK